MTFAVLGPLLVTAQGVTAPVRSEFQRTVLAMLLATPNRVVSIDRLVDVLWGFDGWDQGQRRLWFHVSKLRNRLPAGVEIGRVNSGYLLEVDETTIDSHRFEEAAGRVRELAGFDVTEASVAADQALTLWRGQAYEDVSEEAVGRGERARLEELRLSVMELRYEFHVHQGRHESAIADLEKLIRDHPYRERLHLLRMTALWHSGRSAEALLAFDDAEQMFSRVPSSGAAQSGELAALAGRIRSARSSGTAPRYRPPRHDIYSNTPFAGRTAELDALRPPDTDASRARPAIRFVRGQAGTGKTALLDELVQQAEAEFSDLTAVKVGGHADTGPGEAYGLIRRLLLGSIGEHWNSRRMVTAEGQRRLAQLGPAPVPVTRALRSLEEAGGSAGATDDRLAGSVHAIVDRGPTLLVVDDLQWVDRPSLRVLRRLVEDGPPRLTLVAAYRPEEIDRRSTLVDQLDDLQTISSTVIVDLDDVPHHEQRAFVDCLIDREANELGADFRAMLTERCGGNALYAIELLDEFVRDRSLVRSRGRWQVTTGLDWDRWPTRLQAVLAARFRRLDPETIRLLRAASVEGEEFSEFVLAEVAGTEPDQVAQLLAGELTDARIVSPSHDQHAPDPLVRRYRFRHALVRRYFYDDIGERDRIDLHRKVADALVKLWSGPRRDEGAVEIARHYGLGRAAGPSITYWSRACSNAMRLSANDLATEHAERALALLPDLPDRGRRRITQAELLLQLGAAQGVALGFSSTETLASYERATALLDDTSSVRQQMAAVFGLWVSTCTRAEFQRSGPLVDRMVIMADEIDEDLPRVTALHACWTEALFRGQLGRCIEAAERGRTMYRLDDHPPSLLYGNHDPAVCSLSLGGLALALRGETERADRWLKEGELLAEVVDHRASQAQAIALTAWAAHIRGDRPSARETADRALAPSQVTAPIWQGVARAMRAWSSLTTALDPDEDSAALSSLRRELQVQTANGNHAWTPMYASVLAEALIERGQVDEAGEVLAGQETTNAGGFYRSELLRLRGELAAEQGSLDATSLFEAARAEAATAGALLLELRAAISHYTADAEARPTLAEMVGRLPPGHRSSYLEDARRLLGW
ncbi:MAG: BTAD domain-containing putative transcriptional regulator [Acidimicrobiales bacterium]